MLAPVFAVIWTTTPWTIPANQAINVHPDFLYSLVDTGAGILLLAQQLVEACLARYGLTGTTIAIPTSVLVSSGATIRNAAAPHTQRSHVRICTRK